MRRSLFLQCRRRPLIAKGRGLGFGPGSDQVLQRELQILEQLDQKADLDTYSVLIRLCIASKSVKDGRRVHSHMCDHGSRDVLLHNLLIQMYGTCGSVGDARSVFESMETKNSYTWNIMVAAYAQNGHLLQAKCVFGEMPEKTVVSWTALISAHAQNGYGLEAIQLLKLMDLEGVAADHITFVSAIDACASLKSLELGRRLHSEVVDNRHENNFAVGTALISMYGKCRRIDLARSMFDQMPERNMVTWTALITAYYQNGELHSALQTYEIMPERNVVCTTAVISAYAQNGHLHEAERLFESMAGRNAISWSTMISAYNDNGLISKALNLFTRMETEGIRLDKCTFINILNVYTSLGDITECRKIHAKVSTAGLDSNLPVANTLILMYSKCGGSLDARTVFDLMPQRSLASWNSLISVYAQNGQLQKAKDTLERSPERDLASWNTVVLAEGQTGSLEEAQRLYDCMPLHDVASRNALILAAVLNEREDEAVLGFRLMDLDGIQPNKVSYSSVLEACSSVADLEFGRLVERCAAEDSGLASDAQVGTCLVTMFTKCERFAEAKQAFDRIEGKNVLAWSAMLSSYSQAREVENARRIFDILPARDVPAWNSMISGYSQCGYSSEARELFEGMPEWNVISWTAVLTGYAESKSPKEASRFFRLMDLNGQRASRITFAKALEAIAGGVTEREAKTIHSKVVESGHKDDPQIGVGLLNMYEKCGCVEQVRKVFDELQDKTVVAWSILIAAYSQTGHPKVSVDLFLEMVLMGVMPSEITFVSLLSACSHGGFLYSSWQFFLSMIMDFGLVPFLDHYVCLVDLLGRCGLLRYAEELLQAMPFEPNHVAWTSLLSACKTQGDGKRGVCVSEHVMDLCPTHSGPYGMVRNVYVTSGEALPRWFE